MSTIQYGLTLENENLIIEKAKSKQDGVYAFRGIAYRVKDNKVTHSASNNEIVERCYGFNVVVGKYEYYSEHAKKALKMIK